jgi:hypothetical protein
MTHFQTGQDVALDVDSCSLDELAAQFGRAIARVRAALDERGVGDADRIVRAWISGLDPRARAGVLATVLAPAWPRGCEAIVAAVLAGAAAAVRQAQA